MKETLPAVLQHLPLLAMFPLDVAERTHLGKAAKLFQAEIYDHALIALWNASVNNVRRRIEAYSVELFESVVKDTAGRKRLVADGETLAERWAGVDDAVLIDRARRLGLVNKKAAKVLETIDWMRNHASAAHPTDENVGATDVQALALLLQSNLFEIPIPDPGHSVGGLFEPVKTTALGADELDMLRDQIRAFRPQDLRVCFGFLLDYLCRGEEPSVSNAASLLPTAWERATDDLRKVPGLRYHQYTLDPTSDESADKSARLRILEVLVTVNGVAFIPDAARAALYRQAASKLAQAKKSSYGWQAEERAARELAQYGPQVPSLAFEDVYQEILSVYFGNYWGRSGAHTTLEPFVASLGTKQVMRVVALIASNPHVQDELGSSRPRICALALLRQLRDKVTLAVHVEEVDRAIEIVKAFG